MDTPNEMMACIFNQRLSVQTLPIPTRDRGEVLIHISMAGICNTDIEITRGYVPGFSGIPGHEFIGEVIESDSKKLIGKRVTAEINNGCGTCDYCTSRLERHCPQRTVTGIINRDGAFAEYICVPEKNILIIPEEITDHQALFIEPLAAAREILNQITISPNQSVLLIGDGKLAQLIFQVLSTTGCTLTVVGKHPGKLAHIQNLADKTVLLDHFSPEKFDIVIEASGNSSAFNLGLQCVKPRGTFIIKSTYAEDFKFNPASLVVDEITMIGSRCGIFSQAIDFIQKHNPPLDNLISAKFPLKEAAAAFEKAKRSASLKVVLVNGMN